MRQYTCNKTQVGEVVQQLINQGCTIFGIVYIQMNETYVISYM